MRANLRRNMLVLQHRVMWSILRKLLLQPYSNPHHILQYNILCHHFWSSTNIKSREFQYFWTEFTYQARCACVVEGTNLRRNMLVLQHRVMWSILRKLLLQPDRYTRTEQAWTRPVNGRQDAALHATRTPPGRRKQAGTSPERPVDPALTATNIATTS